MISAQLSNFTKGGSWGISRPRCAVPKSLKSL